MVDYTKDDHENHDEYWRDDCSFCDEERDAKFKEYSWMARVTHEERESRTLAREGIDSNLTGELTTGERSRISRMLK